MVIPLCEFYVPLNGSAAVACQVGKMSLLMTENAAAPSHAEALSMKDIALDVIERVIIAGMFSYFVFRLMQTHNGDLIPSLMIFSEATVVVLIVFRKPSRTMSRSPLDWFLALGATNAGLLVSSVQPEHTGPLQLAYAFVIAGLFIQLSAKIILGRSFGVVAANRGVKASGPYRVVRHPMYAGYVVTHIGFLIALPSLHNFIVYTTGLAIQIARILREERILQQDPAYREFAASVRYRLFPGIF